MPYAIRLMVYGAWFRHRTVCYRYVEQCHSYGSVHLRRLRPPAALNMYFSFLKCGLEMSESDGSAICGGTDSLAQEIITASDVLVAVDVPQIKFNCKMVAVDQALKQATDLVERGVRNWQRTNLSIIDLQTHHFQLSHVFFPYSCIYSLPLFLSRCMSHLIRSSNCDS